MKLVAIWVGNEWKIKPMSDGLIHDSTMQGAILRFVPDDKPFDDSPPTNEEIAAAIHIIDNN
jgi:hypothetical protein